MKILMTHSPTEESSSRYQRHWRLNYSNLKLIIKSSVSLFIHAHWMWSQSVNGTERNTEHFPSLASPDDY